MCERHSCAAPSGILGVGLVGVIHRKSFPVPISLIRALTYSLSHSVLDNGTLLIESAAREDRGYYLCTASNGMGKPLVRAALLTVRG